MFWGRFPLGPPRLNFDSDQAKGLVAWYPLVGDLHDHSWRFAPLSNVGSVSVSYGVSDLGPAALYAANVETYIDRVPLTAEPCTFSAWVRLNADTADVKWISSIGQSVGNKDRILLYLDGTENAIFGVADSVGTSSAVGGTSLSIDVWHHVVGVAYTATDRRVFVNGRQDGTETASKTPSVAPDRTIIGEASQLSGRQFPGLIKDVRFYSRALTPEEVWQLYVPASRWELWSPPQYWFVATEPAAAPVEVSVPVGALTITGYVPSISTGVSVAVPAGALALQGYAPAVQTGVVVDVPVGALALQGYVPVISTGVQVDVPVGSLVIQGYVPVVQTGMAINVPVGTLTITGLVPVVSTGVQVSVPVGALAISGYVPVVATGVSVAVPAGTLTITGYVPSVSIGAAVSVPVGTLTITGLVPALTVGVGATTLTVPAGTLTITGYAPLVTSYARTGLLAQIHTDLDGYLTTYDNLSKVVTHNAIEYRGIFTDVSSIGLQGGTNARDGPWVVMKSDDVDGTISYGDTVTIYSRDWTVEGIQPDGTGTTRLILIPAA